MEPVSDLEAALAHLRRDPVLGGVIGRVGELPWPPLAAADPFASLVRSVIGQQLSVRAADSIEARVRGAAPGLSAPELAALSPDALRALGLSWAKVRTIHALAARVADGTLDFAQLEQLDDEGVIAALTSVPGVGKWTAEMFLMFALARPDVFSWGDAGLRAAVRRLYGESVGPEVALAWSPYRSLAARYLWRPLL